MKAFQKISVLACMMMLMSNAWAEEIVVIVNAKNTQNIEIRDIKNIYADRVVKWNNGGSIKVLNLPVETKERDIFSQAVLGVPASVAAAKEANLKITNRIKNPSLTKRASLISSIVARSSNAIAYIPRSELRHDDRIRVIHNIKE